MLEYFVGFLLFFVFSMFLCMAWFDRPREYKIDELIAEAIENTRDKPPAHYLWKIENFSQLSNAKTSYIESREFYGGKYEWRLRLYLQSIANKKLANENGHISLYLVPSQPKQIPFFRKVLVGFKLFVYNQIQNNYLTVEAEEKKNFQGTSGWGFDELLPLNVFNDPSNGYLIDDCCIFGAEISVEETKSPKADCTSIVKEVGNTYTWKIQNFDPGYQSAVFATGGHKWRLVLRSILENLTLSIYLDSLSTDCPKPYFEYVVIVKDQVYGKDYKVYGSSDALECSESYFPPWSWEVADFIPLSKLNDKSKGYLCDDTLILQVQISCIAITDDFVPLRIHGRKQSSKWTTPRALMK